MTKAYGLCQACGTTRERGSARVYVTVYQNGGNRGQMVARLCAACGHALLQAVIVQGQRAGVTQGAVIPEVLRG